MRNVASSSTAGQNEARQQGDNQRGLNNMQYSRVTKIEFPKFRGEDVRGWLFKCEQFFNVDCVTEDQKYDTYHANYNIEMEDDTMYRAEYGDQYFHPPSYETPSFFNQPQRPTQEYYYQGQRQSDDLNFDEKYDKLMSMIESNKEANQRYEASFAAHGASFVALETHVDRLLEQLNRDETYEPQGITMLDFDDEDKDEGEEKNEEFSLHSTNIMEYSTFSSCKDKEDADDHNNSFRDLISPIIEHDKESVPFKVREEVMEANTTPCLPTLDEPILSPIDDIRSKEDEEFLALSLYKDQCSNLLDEAEVTHILNPPKLPRDEHHVVERCYENSFSKLTHIIVKQVHRKARVGVRNLKDIASRKERVPKTYDYRSQYDAYEYDTNHANYNIEMEDNMMYREMKHITMPDFDDEDEDEGEDQNEEFSLHSTNIMEYSTFGSCKDKEDADDHNNSFGDFISPITEHDKE
uniref:Reverse transcriptase n=1 Tax=Tanacetum cinerariifolium TaxID=118510 RepID=A0A6L2MWS8_TANCI|nr:reverse transcriptase [Tanacetum cinerariifolium]